MLMKKILLYIVLAILITSCRYFEEKRLFSKKVDTLINYAEELDEQVEPDSLDAQIGLEQVETETDIPVDSEEDMFQTKFTSSGNRYYIITGCFMIPDFAESYAEKMQNKGYNAEIILRDDGYHMVSVRSFNDLSESKSALQTVRAELASNAWIYEKK
jgi:hypothetical protein